MLYLFNDQKRSTAIPGASSCMPESVPKCLQPSAP